MATKTKQSGISSKRLANPFFFLLTSEKDWLSRLGASRAVVCNRDKEISDALSKASIHSLWISSGSKMTDELLRVMSRSCMSPHDAGHRLGNLLMLETPRPKTIPFLRGLFENLVGEESQFKWLPMDQLCEVLAGGSEAARDVFIGGVLDTEFALLTLVRGNFARITVPLSIFRPSGTSKPDFRRFEIDDFGHTVRFGEYEASTHFVLYESDSEYRKRMNAKQRAESKGFGPSLRRLRIQKRMSRDDFPGLTAKTIARIERGDVEKPHGSTLAVISKTLGVKPVEIESY